MLNWRHRFHVRPSHRTLRIADMIEAMDDMKRAKRFPALYEALSYELVRSMNDDEDGAYDQQHDYEKDHQS